MKIIKTKYMAPTDKRIRQRVKAWTDKHSIIIDFDSSKGLLSAHFEAVRALVKKYGVYISDNDLDGMVYGSDNDGFYFAFADSTVKEGIKNGY
jgi:hypothetical protein